jgi:hypothetical protein
MKKRKVVNDTSLLFDFSIENNSSKRIRHVDVFYKIIAFVKEFDKFVTFLIHPNDICIYLYTENKIVLASFTLRRSFFSTFEVDFKEGEKKEIVLDFATEGLEEITNLSISGEPDCFLKFNKLKYSNNALESVDFFLKRKTSLTNITIMLINTPQEYMEGVLPDGVTIRMNTLECLKEVKEMSSGKVLTFTFLSDCFKLSSERMKKVLDRRVFEYDNGTEGSNKEEWQEYSCFYGMVKFIKLLENIKFTPSINITFPSKEKAPKPLAIHFELKNESFVEPDSSLLTITSEDDSEERIKKIMLKKKMEFEKIHMQVQLFYVPKIVDEDDDV